MKLLEAKIGVAFGTFLVPFLATILPIKVSAFVERKGAQGKKVLDFLMCFGGGVFFATYLVHMSVEAKDILVLALIEPKGWNYPFAEVIMGMGFFLVLFVDKALDLAIRKNSHKLQKTTKIEKPEGEGNVNGTFTHFGGPENGRVTPTKVEMNSVNCDNRKKYEFGEQYLKLHLTEVAANNGTSPVRKASLSSSAGDANDRHGREGNHHHHHHGEDLLVSSHSVRAVILMVALSLHRIFEGMSMGLQLTVRHAWHLFIAVMCHELVVGFSLGLRLVDNKWSVKRIIIIVAIISIVQPVGVTIGTLIIEVSEPSNTVEIVNGVLQCIATGTFIYVTFFEILGDQLRDAGLLNTFAVLLGFAVMCFLEFIPEQGILEEVSHIHSNCTT